MLTDESKCHTTSVTMELHGMRHFFIVIVFTVCLFITITSVGVFKTYSKKLIGPSINHEKDRELRRRGIDPFMFHNKILHAQSLSRHKLKTHKAKRKEERDTKNHTKYKKLRMEKRNSVPVNNSESATQRNNPVTVYKNISNTLDSKRNQPLSDVQPGAISRTNDRDLHSSLTTKNVPQTTDSERLKSMSSIGSIESTDRFKTYRHHKISKNKHTNTLKFIPLTKAKKNNSRVSLDFNKPRFKPFKKNNYNNGALSSKGELKFRSMHNRLKNMSTNLFKNNTSQNTSKLYGHSFNKIQKYNFSDTSIFSRQRFIPPGMVDSHHIKNSTNPYQAQPSNVLKYKPVINENKDSLDIKYERGHNIEELKRTEK